MQLSLYEANPKNIWMYKQNHPEYVIEDLKEHGVESKIVDLVRQSMLCRGINKWLKVRRDLIAYKKLIKHEIIKLNKKVPDLKKEVQDAHISYKDLLNDNSLIYNFLNYQKKQTEYLIAKERLKLLNDIRCSLKSLCMTDRWQLWEGKELQEMNSIKASDEN